MPPQPLQSLRPMSLHFFEEMFEPFIDQSRNITIRYQIQKMKAKNPENFTIDICSVNDAKNPDDFHRKLTSMTDESIQQVDLFLQSQNPAHIDAQLDYLQGKIDGLGKIVVDESFLIQDEPEGNFRHCQVKSFSTSKLEGPKIGDFGIFGPVICYKTQKFAEMWLTVIQDTKDKVHMIRNMHKSAWGSSTTTSAKDTFDGKKFKIKFNTSVDQEAYLFHFLVKSGIIEVPDRKNPQLFNWIINNFESKNRESIRLTSVQNKYYSHDLSTLDYWDQKFLSGLEFIHNERERLLKFVPQ